MHSGRLFVISIAMELFLVLLPLTMMSTTIRTELLCVLDWAPIFMGKHKASH